MFFSRRGVYAPELLALAGRGPPADRELFEYWGHMASLMPFEMHPLFRWRMAQAADKNEDIFGRLNRTRPGFMKAALDEIRARGALTAREITGAVASKGGWRACGGANTPLQAMFPAAPIPVLH